MLGPKTSAKFLDVMLFDSLSIAISARKMKSTRNIVRFCPSTCHYNESSECAHVSVHKIACYRTPERTLDGGTSTTLFAKGQGGQRRSTTISVSPGLVDQKGSG